MNAIVPQIHLKMEELQKFKIKLERPAAKVTPVGAGAFGKVYGISYNGAPCIAKCLHNILMGRGNYEPVAKEQTTSLFAKFLKECILHSRLRHPSIVQFIGVEYGNDPENYDLHLVMERMDINLESCLEAIPNIPLEIKLSVLREVSAGLLYLHSFTPPIIHGDLTTTNILLTQDWRAKIADFGNSVDENFLSTAPGALAYMPPEAFVKPLIYDAKLDIFSFGTVSLFVGIQAKACDYGKRDELIQRLRDDQQLNCICQIVTWCCDKDQRKRPTSRDLNIRLHELCPHNTQVSHLKKMMKSNSTLHIASETPEVDANRKLADAQRQLEETKRCQEEALEKHCDQIRELKMNLQIQRAMVSQYEDDFAREREDRVRAVEARIKSEEELKAFKEANNIQSKELQNKKISNEVNERLKKENNNMRHQLCGFEGLLRSKQNELDAVKKELEDLEDMMQKQLKILKNELGKVNEESAAQIKQVEAYKQRLEQCTCKSSVGLAPSLAPQQAEVRQPHCMATSSSQPVHTESTDPYIRGHEKIVCDGDSRLNPSSKTWGSNGDDKDDDSDDDLPPPIFHKPFQPMYHPVVAHGMRKEDVPLSQLEAFKISAAVRQTNGCFSPAAADLEQTVKIHVSGEMYRNVSHVAGAIQRETDDRAFEDTCSIVPLDPNLKCPICRKVFKKGRIQKYKRHVQICEM